MKLATARFSGFRSIENLELANCGGFNVIVGKNNSGKSNMLLAINAFFSCLKSGEPVSIRPPIGASIDYHQGRTNIPIELSLIFALSSIERESLLKDITEEAPQLRHAIEGIGTEIQLKITIAIVSGDEPFSFIRHIVLYANGATGIKPTERPLLSISDAAGVELAENARIARVKMQDTDTLNKIITNVGRFDPDDWERVRGDASPSRRLLRSYNVIHSSNAPSPSSEVEGKLDAIVRTSETASLFKKAAQSLISSTQEESTALKLKPLKYHIESFSGQQDSIPVYALKLLRSIGQTKILYLTERRDPIGRKEASQLLDLKVRRGGPEKLRSIQETVSALLGVEIDAFRGEGRIPTGELPAELDVDRFLVQVNGAGIREALRLILDYELEKPDILLVEEPEVHLHPALETSMMRYLKAIGAESQIFITTHSTNFLDTAEMRNVYLASRGVSTSVQAIDASEAESSIPTELGIRLSSLFMFDRLVFVEGNSDEEVIREWASTLNVNLGQSGVGFISMGGVRNLSHFAAEKTLSFLSKRRVKMWFLIDRDERADDEIEKLSRSLSSQAKLVTLARREIENYLIAPQAIASMILHKKGLAGDTSTAQPSAAEITRTLNDCADQLKDVAIAYRVVKETCGPRYIDRKAVLEGDLSKALEERVSQELAKVRMQLSSIEEQTKQLVETYKQVIDRDWQTQKLDLIPGDLLLDSLFKKYGLRFKKERDSPRLASFMRSDDIAPEIRHFVLSLKE